MRILIVSTYFPPLNSIASLRPYSWAKYWAAMGHEVTVLTTEKPRSTIRLNADISFLNVIEVPTPAVTFLRKFDYNGNLSESQNCSYRNHNHHYLIPFLNKIRRKFGLFATARMPDHYDLWIFPALKALPRQRWDLVVSSHGPYACHMVALRLKSTGRTKRWIADFRDLWTDNHIFKGCFPFSLIEISLEKRVAINADALTTVSDPLAKKLRTKYGNKVHVIENGIDPDDYVSLEKVPAFPEDDLIRIVYTGTIYSGKRNPEPLFKAMSQLRHEDHGGIDRLRVIFAGRQLQAISDLAAQFQIADLVTLEGFVSRERALIMQRDADALLFLEFEAPGLDGILTGKIFEYLASGTRIIGIGLSSSSSAGKLVTESGTGEMLGSDVNAIKTALRRLLSERSSEKHLDPIVLERFNRKRLAEKMLGILNG